MPAGITRRAYRSPCSNICRCSKNATGYLKGIRIAHVAAGPSVFMRTASMEHTAGGIVLVHVARELALTGPDDQGDSPGGGAPRMSLSYG